MLKILDLLYCLLNIELLLTKLAKLAICEIGKFGEVILATYDLISSLCTKLYTSGKVIFELSPAATRRTSETVELSCLQFNSKCIHIGAFMIMRLVTKWTNFYLDLTLLILFKFELHLSKESFNFSRYKFVLVLGIRIFCILSRRKLREFFIVVFLFEKSTSGLFTILLCTAIHFG